MVLEVDDVGAVVAVVGIHVAAGADTDTQGASEPVADDLAQPGSAIFIFASDAQLLCCIEEGGPAHMVFST